MDRKPVVAGQFYPAQKEEWLAQVKMYLNADGPFTKLSNTEEQKQAVRLVMLPHAGHIFSGSVAGRTLARVELSKTGNQAPRVLLLGPNHTGQGKRLALWPQGKWLLPGAELEVDAILTRELLAECPLLQEDTQAHLYEHSLEVILPFLWAMDPATKIVPLCIAEPGLDNLLRIGQDLAQVISAYQHPVTIIVSSDMSHFISKDLAQNRDQLALDAILDIDPEKLYQQVRRHNISMCGVLPMTVGLSSVRALGASQASLIAYSTSGDITGDYDQVVGYAGIVIF